MVFVGATHVYILAKRKTTELVQPQIGYFHGNRFVGGDNVVTSYTPLSDFGFTKKEWNRRVHELLVTPEEIDAYFDECRQRAEFLRGECDRLVGDTLDYPKLKPSRPARTAKQGRH